MIVREGRAKIRRFSGTRARSNVFSRIYEIVASLEACAWYTNHVRRVRERSCKMHDTFISKSVHTSLLTGRYAVRLEQRPA